MEHWQGHHFFGTFSDTVQQFDIGGWDASSGYTFDSMFSHSNFTGDLSKWDVLFFINLLICNYQFIWKKRRKHNELFFRQDPNSSSPQKKLN